MKDRYLLSLIIAAISLILCGCRNDVEDNKENQTIAQPVILALDDYQKLNDGEYPSALDDLVPEYIASIPETVREEEFFYYPDKLEGYYLCFLGDKNDKYGCCYNKRFDAWDCTPGD